MAMSDESVEPATAGEGEAEPEPVVELVAKRNTIAPVWKHFGFEADEKGKPRSPDHPKCRVCHQDVATKDGNTSNLYSHLKNRHPELYLQVEKKRPSTARPAGHPSLSEAWQRTQTLASSSREHKELTKAVTYCLAKDILPISTVDKPGFKAMLQRFNPRYQVPSRNYFTRVSIPALVSEVKGAIELKIEGGEWKLAETLHQWKLAESQLVGITSDSGSNVKLACELLKWKRLSCFGHNLNLAVEKGLNDARVQRVLRLCKSVVATFSRSWKKQRDLTIIQEQKGLPTHKLKADVVTRWGSSYEMVERLLEQMEAVRVVLASDRKSSHLIPTWQDCDVLDSISAALKPLKEMTDALSGEKCVTVSAVKPLLNYITTDILVDKEGDSELTKEMKERVKVDLEILQSRTKPAAGACFIP